MIARGRRPAVRFHAPIDLGLTLRVLAILGMTTVDWG
jgi:hypothetical protein